MCSFHNLKPRYTYYADPPDRTGAGTLGNDEVRRCYKCNEPIAFKRLPNDTYQLLDYFTGQQHVHRKEVHEGN